MSAADLLPVGALQPARQARLRDTETAGHLRNRLITLAGPRDHVASARAATYDAAMRYFGGGSSAVSSSGFRRPTNPTTRGLPSGPVAGYWPTRPDQCRQRFPPTWSRAVASSRALPA